MESGIHGSPGATAASHAAEAPPLDNGLVTNPYMGVWTVLGRARNQWNVTLMNAQVLRLNSCQHC